MSTDLVARLQSHPEPAIRYRFLREVLLLPETDVKVIDARQAVKDGALVSRLLSPRGADGRLPWHAYSKWRGAFWTLLQLEDLGYPPEDHSLMPLLEQVYDWLLDEARLKKIPLIDGRYRRCALQEASAVFCAIRFGLVDERVERLVHYLLKWQWPDGGWNCDKKPQASHSSFYETWLPLRAMYAYAELSGDRQARAAAERAAEVFLSHRLYKRHSDGATMIAKFEELAYPPYWHYDILVGLRLMMEIGRLDDPRCKDALDWLESKRLPDGSFAASTKYYQVTQKDISGVSLVQWGLVNPHKTNDFVTVRVLGVLKKAGRL